MPDVVHQPTISLSPYTVIFTEGARHADFTFDTSLPSRTIQVDEVAFARLTAGTAVLFGADRKIVRPTSYLLKDRDVSFPEFLHKRAPDIGNGRIIISYNAGWRNYYHFLVQASFSTWLFSTFFSNLNARFLFPSLTDVAKRLLSLAGASQDNSVFVHKNLSLEIPTAFILEETYVGDQKKPSSLLPLFARDIMRKAGARDRQPIRIYVSRRDSKSRAMYNEEAVEQALASHGYEIVSLTGMSLVEQMSIFSSADEVIAPHGAGLSNLIFCRPGTRVLEIAPDFYVNPCFAYISQVMHLDHTVLVFHVPEANPVARHTNSWKVDIDYLLQKL